jgi:hypothetical protein
MFRWDISKQWDNQTWMHEVQIKTRIQWESG